MSSAGSDDVIDAVEVTPSKNVTLMREAPWTTWSAVRMSPCVSMMIPEPRSSLPPTVPVL